MINSLFLVQLWGFRLVMVDFGVYTIDMLRKIISVYTKYFAVWVLLFGVIAYYCPAPFTWFKDLFVVKTDKFSLNLLECFFILTMFGIGAVLQVSDFKRIAKNPIVVLIGVCAQFTIMPIGAFVIARTFHFSDELTIGLVITGSAPGAMASNVMTYISKADTAYSVSLTTVSTILCPLLTPMLTLLLAGRELEVAFMDMFIKLFVTIVLPILTGFLVRHYFKKNVEKIIDIFPAISVTFIILICAVVIAANRSRLIQLTGPILAAGIILNLYGMSSGYGVGALFKMDKKRRRTLAIEIGMQNAGLGVILASSYVSDMAALPAAMFVFLCIFTASIMAEVWKRQADKEEQSTMVSQ